MSRYHHVGFEIRLLLTKNVNMYILGNEQRIFDEKESNIVLRV